MRKLRIITVIALSLILIGLCAAGYAEPANISKQCEVSVSQGKVKPLLSSSLKDYWTSKKAGDTVTITAKDADQIGGISIRWYEAPKGYTLSVYDREGNLLSERTDEDFYLGLENFFPLDEGAYRAVLTMAEKNQKISGIRISSESTPFGDLPDWEKPVSKADLMVISTHQDDEFLFFGGTIPYYSAVREKETAVVYMTDCGRDRCGEALAGLWASGHRNYPVFLNLRDKKVDSIKEGLKLWGGEDRIVELLVEQIRELRPEVIVTHDLKGEYGHNQHKITAHLAEVAVEKAADPEYHPDSVAAYGAWQTKKLYLHLYKENSIKMDWRTPYDELNGMTPSQAAALGYKQHASQHKYFTYQDGGAYDNARFGLAYTAVGYDTGSDFFENIPE